MAVPRHVVRRSTVKVTLTPTSIKESSAFSSSSVSGTGAGGGGVIGSDPGRLPGRLPSTTAWRLPGREASDMTAWRLPGRLLPGAGSVGGTGMDCQVGLLSSGATASSPLFCIQ
jgi:hypothetical protein